MEDDSIPVQHSQDTIVYSEQQYREYDENDDFNDDNCDFCMIVNGINESTEILKKDAELVCFRDILPAAPHHYLVVTRRHIVNCRSLCTEEHVDLVERMAEMGRCVLKDNNVTDPKDVRMGFHWPPYISIPHLHLHVLAPASQISEHMAHKYLPCTDRFTTEDCLRARLKSALGARRRTCQIQYCCC
ncbi:adenosine 5'-monophosphoramidase HINT3-like [Osmerus mordax]|uniref:adenosine 5'-monophosphoramidase HINT3-like n=1 Tax=Osmerus mordax TaxID=8014 RepID=UPI003510571C